MEGRGLHSLPGRALRYPASQIRWKVIAPYALLVVALAVAGTVMVTRLIGGSLDERFNNQLIESSRVVSDSVVRRERGHLQLVRSVAFTEGVAEGAAARNPWQLAALVEPLAVNSGIDRLEVLDASGTRLYGLAAQGPDAAYVQLDDADADRSAPQVGEHARECRHVERVLQDIAIRLDEDRERRIALDGLEQIERLESLKPERHAALRIAARHEKRSGGVHPEPRAEQ